MSASSPCRCSQIPILWAAQADAYADSLLVRELTDENAVSRFWCARCRRKWLQDHPADEQGRLTLRLRWAELTAADVVRYLAGEPGVDAYMLTMDPEVEHQPLPDEPVLHGLGALREYTQRYLAADNPPRTAALDVIEGASEALVLGRISHARDGQYVEHRPAAWIVDVQDARVTRVRAFAGWARARELLRV